MHAPLTGCAPTALGSCTSNIYDLCYQYDNSQRVVKASITSPEGEIWIIDYIYDTLLLEARINNPNESDYGRFLYERDLNGRLIRKKIHNSEGVELGRVDLTYDVNSNIVQVVFTVPSDLPFLWDPIVDH